MKFLFIVTLLSFKLFAANDLIKSKDDIIFHTPDKFKFSEIGKIPEFKGIIERIYFKSADMKFVDFYQFKTELVKIDKKLCLEYVDKMFGVSKSKIREIKNVNLFDTNKGKVCEVVISDKKVKIKKKIAYNRLVYIGFVNSNATALVFHPEKVNDDISSEASGFWSSLR